MAEKRPMAESLLPDGIIMFLLTILSIGAYAAQQIKGDFLSVRLAFYLEDFPLEPAEV